MKKTLVNRSLLIIMMIAAMGISVQLSGQGKGSGTQQKQNCTKSSPEMHMKKMIPDLTDDQMKKIKALHTGMLKQINPIKAEMREKQAHLNTLSIAEKPDMVSINKTIDEISTLKSKMMKVHAKYRQDFRALLTSDQRVIYDSKKGHRMGKGNHHKGNRSSCGPAGPGGCR